MEVETEGSLEDRPGRPHDAACPGRTETDVDLPDERYRCRVNGESKEALGKHPSTGTRDFNASFNIQIRSKSPWLAKLADSPESHRSLLQET